MLRVAALTSLAIVAFAANSVLARLALSGGSIDAAGYTGVRLAAGALALFAILWSVNRKSGPSQLRLAGSWRGAVALLGYAAAFSVAYLLLMAGTGALILFGSVQLGILGRAVMAGDRPGVWEWMGAATAFGALVYLVSPGVTSPDPLGAALMVGAGLCWAAYSLMGRNSRSPLADTTGNFLRCAPVAVVLIIIAFSTHWPRAEGLAYAIASGAIASGVGYAIWYAVLPALTRARAAIVQLTVPAVAALGAVVFIGEPLTPRLVTSSILVMAGVGTAIVAGERRKINAL